ncbi:MAG: UDP-2,3-diacylglucosamine diphosphatase LpxI [Candidatus Omnitrophica bacterium]|nr:UDP-2,3-diacylglucosamine diphosphatase LpxI [Candidatus Omnitrophota bacterium]
MAETHQKVGLIAGNGHFPLIWAAEAKKHEREVIAIGLREETEPALEQIVDRIHWVQVGELGKLFEILKREALVEVVMAGQVRPQRLLAKGLNPDSLLTQALNQVKDLRADSLLGTFARMLESQGVRVLNSTLFLEDSLAGEGVLTQAQPSDSQREDVQFGLQQAKVIAGADIGQTIVVRSKAVLAVEAIEGTDAAIRRGGQLGGPGAVVVKVAKPKQDMRFDVPVVGESTLRTLQEAQASVLAVETGRTLFIGGAGFIRLADSAGIVLMGVKVS